MPTLTGRIFRSVLLTAVAVVLLAGLLASGLVYTMLDAQLRRELLNTAELIERSLPAVGDEAAYLSDLSLRDLRITWIATDGSVLYDSAIGGEAPLENHLDRPEVRSALETGSGFARRHSQTLDEETVYLARRLPEGSVLRVAGTQRNLLGYMAAALLPSALILVVAALVAAVAARLISRRILSPLDKLDFEHPLETESYPELAPLLSRLAASGREIIERKAQLDERQGIFDAVTESMREGLVLIDAQGAVLSINEAAISVFGSAAADVMGRHLLALNRSEQIQAPVEAALKGQRAQGYLEQGGRVYRLFASPVLTDGEPNGAALLVLDVTEWHRADLQRREFTANVSHELKTPLTVINGYAELLSQGTVPPEDALRFSHLVHEEATRLITLVDDIITLSRLDEGKEGQGDLPAMERVELCALATEVVERLEPFAKSQGVRLSLCALVDAAMVRAMPTLLSKMLYNLVENGIRYTDPGGEVTVGVGTDGDAAQLSVLDTGIGIPERFHDKVFERFFCVDSSR
ncbi:MAG: PAS domain-containing protein, partial [Coriobacteriales bacterium]|nr:PAS domain-containing protein [Coriobacteriales bacterium]